MTANQPQAPCVFDRLPDGSLPAGQILGSTPVGYIIQAARMVDGVLAVIPGHYLIFTNRHVPELDSLSPEELMRWAPTVVSLKNSIPGFCGPDPRSRLPWSRGAWTMRSPFDGHLTSSSSESAGAAMRRARHAAASRRSAPAWSRWGRRRAVRMTQPSDRHHRATCPLPACRRCRDRSAGCWSCMPRA